VSVTDADLRNDPEWNFFPPGRTSAKRMKLTWQMRLSTLGRKIGTARST
jgi:hypothetical protein